MSVCAADQVAELLPGALAGRTVIAPVGEHREQTLAMLRPELEVTEPGAAAIVATSGSSGTPKGVVLGAGALLAAAEAAQRVLGRMTWTCVLPTGYVAGLMVLVRGHVAGTTTRFAPASLDGLDPAPGANAISIVPTQLFRALERPELVASLARFDAILLGGAAVEPTLLDRARSLGLNLVTTYGMSETCGGCVWDGVPLPGVDAALGEDGRIELTGPMAFSGYRLRPDLTAQTLRTDGDRRTVLTQDRGTIVDGTVRVLGRLDEVVISGGVNVDLAAVQRAVERIDPASSLVLALPDAEWGSLVTLVTARSEPMEWWREALAGDLGRAALPRRLVRREVLPRTASGKIDRQCLLRELQEG